MIKKSYPVVTTILILVVLMNLFPFFNLLLNAFRNHFSIASDPLAFRDFTIANFGAAEAHAKILRGLLNGIFISILTIILLGFCGAMGSYALTFIRLPLSGVVKAFLSVGYFIPPASLLITGFLFMRDIHLLNTFLGIALLYSALYTSFTTLFLTGFMKSVPRSLLEAARIDGASHFTCYMKIVLPMSRSAMVTLIILLFLWTYRDFMWPLILMARPTKRTIAVSLAMFVSDRQMDFGVLSAAVVVSLAPVLTTYIILKERIMAGMAAGSVKG